MKYYSPLTPWLERTSTLPDFAFLELGQPNFELGGFLGIDVCYPLHDVNEHKARSLETAWKKLREYVNDALDITQNNTGNWLDREEVEMIKEELGEPPFHCYPIYLITVGTFPDEKVVYVGKTSSNVSRFVGGHRAALKLHDPLYANLPKMVYFCSVVFIADGEYLPIEWISPIKDALAILDSVESHLISSLKPVLNTSKTKRNYSNHSISLHIQNFTESRYLNDVMV
ncbi:hypothetical protein [Paenibacillus alvei]|uniref:hypothetical protein n=1 Tax=Paenibacillus alvei TaxID=44250 RepID=UPI0013DC43AA|nr:hypothetical protein [Paenibacillus alvei]NEZ45447.1 hypothetical protein [Paenibacillus alvei]